MSRLKHLHWLCLVRTRVSSERREGLVLVAVFSEVSERQKSFNSTSLFPEAETAYFFIGPSSHHPLPGFHR